MKFRFFTFKVIYTIYWLSRKSSEFGISLAYHFDINNPTNHFTKTDSRSSFTSKAVSNSLDHKNSVKRTSYTHNSTATNHKPKAICFSQPSGSTNSTSSSSSSSPYFSSSSNSSLNQYSVSSVSASSSFTSSNPAHSASLSVIVCQSSQKQLPPSLTTPLSPTSTSSLSNDSTHLLTKKSSFSTEHQLAYSDEITTPVSNSSSVYESCVTNRSSKMSYIYKQHQHKQPSKANEITSPSNGNSTDQETAEKKSHDETSETSALVSPQANAATNLHIPTRYSDRRVSTSAISTDPHKFNVKYAEVGQRIARKAQETIKKAKEIDANDALSTAPATSKRSDSVENGNGSGSGSGGGSANDDWQNVIEVFLFFSKLRIVTQK